MNSRFTVANLVRDYLSFFETRGHTVVPSAPLLPEDPTLLFTAAGMVPFKAYYSNPASAPYPRAASVQKCLRAGGKQSDLENVGRTLRHHTFFEMLGNFSFGDYFKKEAIEWGWELSVDVWGLDRSRLWVTIFENDDEAFELWSKHIGFPKERIIRLGRKDNFWGPVGDTGVCGPSSEMHYDTGREGPDGGPGQDDSDRYIEYWNLVFPQFFYTAEGKYDPLPRPGIDTGMGLERMAFILQGAEDNFHTDEFLPIRRAIAAALPGDADANDPRAALAVNAASDHVRALTFALAEGIMPSNEGRGYVLRRLLRRALTKMNPFGVREPFLARGVEAVVHTMGPRYPELRSRAALVKDVITAEETRFLDTLEQGMNRLQTIFDAAGKKKTVSGADTFMLYDTFGFPPELTQEMAEERGLRVDMAAFEAAMKEQKERARKASFHRAGPGESVVTRTVRPVNRTEFLGYEALECEAKIATLGDARADRVARQHEAGSFLEFTTDRTVFYPEGGGQVGDAGAAMFGDLNLFVVDTYRAGDQIAHLARVSDAGTDEVMAALEEKSEGRLHVYRERRHATMRNHTATHLLHAALRRVLGDHVAQAGSLVAPDRLRFDFHHFQAMKPGEVQEVERMVNEAVMEDLAVTDRQMPYKDAIKTGAMALFGEKYGDVVRVVSIENVSKELCGGTHIRHTGEIGSFFIRQETAVASGVRRVEALTGAAALELARRSLDEWSAVALLLRVTPAEVEARVRALMDENDALQRERKKEEARRAEAEAGDALADAV
ncbi:MAG TPA: alanine--tRNA ligase, partial [Candidatus Krumholzibacteria bacterium]|nr:alanine--tRNA ligase [Candidatus Krumholzibacteria bacterium]